MLSVHHSLIAFVIIALGPSLVFQAATAEPIPFNRTAEVNAAPTSGWPLNGVSSTTFGVSSGFKSTFLKTRENKRTLVGNYPKGSYAGSKTVGIAGFIFEAKGGPANQVDLANAKEVTLTYSIKFSSGFGWALGGKLPGLYGGNDAATANRCTGGNHFEYCWSARLMWRDYGKGELYLYVPSSNKNGPLCKNRNCNMQYGISIGTGAWSFKSNTWTTVTQRIKLNSLGKFDGEVEVKTDGVTRIYQTGISFRDSNPQGKIRGAMLHTFFGGSSTPAYQSPKNQEALFNGISVKVTKKFFWSPEVDAHVDWAWDQVVLVKNVLQDSVQAAFARAI